MNNNRADNAKKHTEEPKMTVSHEHQARVEKVAAMRAVGIEPWPANKEVTATCKDVLDEFEHEAEKKVYAVAGRIMARREHGKTAFVTIQDASGRLQLYVRQDVLGEAAFTQFQHFIDVGDIIWVSGTSFRTKMGEITLKVEALELLSKCLHPLPEKFHGLTDIETIYRQRYLDLITNPESKQRFVRRSQIIKTMREFFDAHGYIEVETPMLHPIPGGAAAKPFVTHHNALDRQLYLRIAPELYLKQLAVGGFERVYEINRNFRNEGISTRHNPEFTMIEFYTAHKDYHFVMNFVEQLLRKAVLETCGELIIPFGDLELDFASPFARLSMRDAVIKYGKLKPEDIAEGNIDRVIKEHGVRLNNTKASWGEKLMALFEEFVEPNLINPTFIIDFPIEVSPLAKRDANNPAIAARFELFAARMELANGFNELNDPFDQAERFRDQAKAHAAGDAEAHHYDADYIQALEYGLPPTVGVGIGIDRLTMLLTSTTSIKDVILFPTLKKRD